MKLRFLSKWCSILRGCSRLFFFFLFGASVRAPKHHKCRARQTPREEKYIKLTRAQPKAPNTQARAVPYSLDSCSEAARWSSAFFHDSVVDVFFFFFFYAFHCIPEIRWRHTELLEKILAHSLCASLDLTLTHSISCPHECRKMMCVCEPSALTSEKRMRGKCRFLCCEVSGAGRLRTAHQTHNITFGAHTHRGTCV